MRMARLEARLRESGSYSKSRDKPSLRAGALPLLLALGVAGAYGFSTLWSDFLLDDWSLLAMMQGRMPAIHGTLDLYRFLGSAADVKRLTAHGPFPWFCAPGLKLALFRPLSAVLLLLDNRLFGNHAFGWHLHSALWYLALVGAAALVLSRVVERGTLTLALILFAASDSHLMTLAWISNRHSEISVTLALLGLWAHLRAREASFRPGVLLAPALCTCALLASETALSVLAYFAAFELWGCDGALRTRLRALSPFALLAVAYLLLYKLGGYGTSESGSYVDPLSEPLAFLRTAPERFLSLIGSFFIGPPADMQLQMPSLSFLWPTLGILALVLVLILLRGAMSELTALERRKLRWLFLGAVLSFLPSLGAMPGSRLLLVPSLGGVTVCAVLLRRAWQKRARVGGKWLFLTLVLMLAIRPALSFAGSLALLQRYALMLPRIVHDSELPTQPDAVILAPVMPDFILSIYTPAIHLLENPQGLTQSYWVLSFAPHEHLLTRTAPDRIELTTIGGAMLRTPFERLFRSAAIPFHRGDEVALSGMTITILDEQAGSPTRIEARFARSLDDPSLFCMEWRDGRLLRMALPKVGSSVRIPRRPSPFGM
jgi:hypothetical protein